MGYSLHHGSIGGREEQLVIRIRAQGYHLPAGAGGLNLSPPPPGSVLKLEMGEEEWRGVGGGENTPLQVQGPPLYLFPFYGCIILIH